MMLHLKIITPSKVVLEDEVKEVIAPGADGEFTVLPRHTNLFSMLQDGIITVKRSSGEESFAIGSGYLQTDGKQVSILVTRAHGQDEINQVLTEKAIKEAEEILKRSKDDQERVDATMLLRRSTIDLKLLKRKGTRRSV